MPNFTLFQHFADSCLQNDPFFLISRIRASHWKIPLFSRKWVRACILFGRELGAGWGGVLLGAWINYELLKLKLPYICKTKQLHISRNTVLCHHSLTLRCLRIRSPGPPCCVFYKCGSTFHHFRNRDGLLWWNQDTRTLCHHKDRL